MLLNRGRNALGTSSGGGSYTAQAVHFNGDSDVVPIIQIPSITTTDTGKLTYCGWFKVPLGYTPVHNTPPFLTGHLGDLFFPADGYSNPLLDLGTNSAGDLSFRQDGGPPDYPNAQFFSDGGAMPDDVWTFVLVSVDATTNPATGNVIVGTTQVHDAAHDLVDAHAAYAFRMSGQQFWFPYEIPDYGDSINFPFDCADIQMWDGVCVTSDQLADLIDTNGKPVDPAQAAATFGPQTFLFSGNATSFATNQGSGGIGHLYACMPATSPTAAGPGPIDVPGAVSGTPILKVWAEGAATSFVAVEVTTGFESTISVNGQIQQTSSSDYTGAIITVGAAGTLTNATTSPSD